MKVYGFRRRGRSKTIWMDYLKNDMNNVNTKITANRLYWEKKTCCADLPR